MDIASSLLVPDWSRVWIRGNQGVVTAETGFKDGRGAALWALSILTGAGCPIRGLQAGHLIGRRKEAALSWQRCDSARERGRSAV